ncbi:MAG: dienelactone hydrolase family protein [Alsobacter sp.]
MSSPRGPLLVAGLFAASLTLLWSLPGRAAEPERVRVTGGSTTLPGLMYKPAGTGPFPAVVALHGCGGLFDKAGKPDARTEDWGNRLAGQGFVVLFPDSFGPRGVSNQCRTRERVARSSRERRADAHAARRWLQHQGFVKPEAINLMGWSNGGSSVLYAVRKERLSRPGRGVRVIGPDFARAVAFYPGCRVPADKGRFQSRMPLMILIGEADDWTPARYCQALATQTKGSPFPVTFVGYPGAYHDFDWPDRPVTVLKGLAFAAGGGGEAHSGTDAAARADAIEKATAFLAR